MKIFKQKCLSGIVILGPLWLTSPASSLCHHEEQLSKKLFDLISFVLMFSHAFSQPFLPISHTSDWVGSPTYTLTNSVLTLLSL